MRWIAGLLLLLSMSTITFAQGKEGDRQTGVLLNDLFYGSTVKKAGVLLEGLQQCQAIATEVADAVRFASKQILDLLFLLRQLRDQFCLSRRELGRLHLEIRFGQVPLRAVKVRGNADDARIAFHSELPRDDSPS